MSYVCSLADMCLSALLYQKVDEEVINDRAPGRNTLQWGMGTIELSMGHARTCNSIRGQQVDEMLVFLLIFRVGR